MFLKLFESKKILHLKEIQVISNDFKGFIKNLYNSYNLHNWYNLFNLHDSDDKLNSAKKHAKTTNGIFFHKIFAIYKNGY